MTGPDGPEHCSPQGPLVGLYTFSLVALTCRDKVQREGYCIAAHMFPFPHQNALAACEFLLQNSAQVNQADSNGRGPLHHATILGHTG